MTKCIFYTTRAITGREGKNIARHFTILRHTHDIVDMLTANSDKGEKVAGKLGLLTVSSYRNHYGSFYEQEAKNMIDWMAVYESINPIALKEYNALYLIGGLDLHRSNLGRFENRVGVFPRDRGQLKFQSAGVHLVNILAMVKAHNEYGIPLHEIAYDPNEMSCDLFHPDIAPVKNKNYHLYHGYDIPLYGANRLDSLQHWLQASVNPLFPEDYSNKSIDFTFGYTVLLNSGREHYPEQINQISEQFSSAQLFSKNEYTKENTHVDGDKYLDYIKQSRFTYMLPSYNSHCFSIYRFLESIHHDCLPLIHPDCNINDISKSFNIELSSLVTNIVPSECDRLAILAMLKSTMLTTEKSFR